ncbi:DNA repair protein RadC [bacterium]|nr:DNA repair protein RadC [bacterium]
MEGEKSAGGDPVLFGEVFERELIGREHFPGRLEWLREKAPCLSELNAYRFLSGVGWPVFVPDNPAQNFLFRLGLIPTSGNSSQVRLDACRKAEDAAHTINRTIREFNLWVRAFTGALPGLSPKTALCGRKPLCDRCDLQTYCNYYRYRRPRQNGDVPLSVKQWRPTDRPRERLLQHGAHDLEDTELLAIILRTGTGRMNVMDLARRLLERFETLQGIEDASLEELMSLPGIGPMKAVELKAVFELGRRQTLRSLKPGDSIESSDEVFSYYQARFSRVKQEEFILLMLNNKNEVIREEVVSRGGLDASIVHPREVFKAAIRASAAAVIFIHNHPSGNPEPSRDDYHITQRLEEAANLLQIRVLDHVIIGRDSYFSFTEGEIVQPGGKG